MMDAYEKATKSERNVLEYFDNQILEAEKAKVMPNLIVEMIKRRDRLIVAIERRPNPPPLPEPKPVNLWVPAMLVAVCIVGGLILYAMSEALAPAALMMMAAGVVTGIFVVIMAEGKQ